MFKAIFFGALILAIILPYLAFAQESTKTMDFPPTYKAITLQKTWLNVPKAITPADLQNRIILLDFWTFCCINCMHVIPDLKYLEKKFGDKLTVIGVHSAKFKNEQDTENIRNAILRYGIEHPVVNDFDFTIWRNFRISSWPSFVLIAPDGEAVGLYAGEGNRSLVEDDINKLIVKYKDKLANKPLELALEKNKQKATILSFPGKIISSGEKSGLFISDSGHHRILQVGVNGAIENKIGSGVEGFKDGSFSEAEFRRPQGLLYKDQKLYVADTENHALRLVDFVSKKVTTLVGDGVQGYDRFAKNISGKKMRLASPWDLAFYPDDQHIVIANAGTHQLMEYNLAKNTVSALAGNGRESIDDGRYPFNSLSQPSGLSGGGDKLYFVDSETSSLRVYQNGEIKTLIGTGLFDFGYKEGKQGQALLQHPLGLFASKYGVYIADSYNHSVRFYDFAKETLSNFIGNGKRGKVENTLSLSQFNEPADIKIIDNILYVADTNNNRIAYVNLKTHKTGYLDIRDEDASKNIANNKNEYSYAEILPNLEILPQQKVASKDLQIKINLKKGWKINKEAPSYIALYENKKLIQAFEREELKTGKIKVKDLAAIKNLELQATIYYCEDKENSQCLIKSLKQELTVSDKVKNSLIEIKL